MKISMQEAAAALLAADDIVITAHVNPDGDAIGSSLGLKHFLAGMGKRARVVIDDDIPECFSYLPGIEEIARPGDEPASCGLLVILDANMERTGNTAKLFQAPVINIDHHVTNDGKADKLYLDGDRAATAEIIYQLVKEMQGSFTREMAFCLYTGMATDSGFFRYSNTTVHLMQAAGEMIAAGAVPNVVSEAVDKKPYEVVTGIASAVQKAELFADGKAVGVFMDQASLQGLSTTEGLIDQLRVIEGIDVAVFVKEKEPGSCRVSMRSYNTDVAALATQFDGGGHVRAAGCTLKMPIDEARVTIMKAIEEAINS